MREGRRPLVFIVNGYGCHLDTPLGWVYLPRVARCVAEEKPDLVIFCGGPTQLKTAGDISEARVMHDFIQRSDPKAQYSNRGVLFLVEENSYTTLDNSREAGRIISFPNDNRKIRVKHFCEATRAANVVMLDRHFLIKQYQLVDSIDDITVETASWERADPFKQAGNLIYNKLAITFPWLGLAERENRRRMRRAREI